MSTKAKSGNLIVTLNENGKLVPYKRPKGRNAAERLIILFRELDMEMDGVRVPASAAAVLNGIRAVLNEIE